MELAEKQRSGLHSTPATRAREHGRLATPESHHWFQFGAVARFSGRALALGGTLPPSFIRQWRGLSSPES